MTIPRFVSQVDKGVFIPGDGEKRIFATKLDTQVGHWWGSRL